MLIPCFANLLSLKPALGYGFRIRGGFEHFSCSTPLSYSRIAAPGPHVDGGGHTASGFEAPASLSPPPTAVRVAGASTKPGQQHLATLESSLLGFVLHHRPPAHVKNNPKKPFSANRASQSWLNPASLPLFLVFLLICSDLIPPDPPL